MFLPKLSIYYTLRVPVETETQANGALNPLWKYVDFSTRAFKKSLIPANIFKIKADVL